jgi:hypothetical protein
MVDRLYNDNDPAAVNITGINSNVCELWFGRGAIKSTRGDYCICKSYAYPIASNTHCRKNLYSSILKLYITLIILDFLINVTTDEFKTPETCPANTEVISASSV